MDALCSRAESLLKDELREASPHNDDLIKRFESLTPSELADLFVKASFFKSILPPLIDQDWIRQHRSDPSAHDARPAQLENELRGLQFLGEEIITASSKRLKAYFSRATHLIQVLVLFVQMEGQIEESDRYRTFVLRAMKQIDECAREQASYPLNHFSESMYRAFDQMDEILGIRYELDHGMTSDPAQRERLYEGAGVGVQTSYSSILLALQRADVAPNARILDLGSGYGRVGFVLGLLRPDVHFTGIEYVDHRVRDARSVAKRIGLSRTEFLTEDLNTYAIPEADVYYMYDPFSQETYGFVLRQLIEQGQNRAITIITKGRAKTWVREALQTHGWLIDETCDGGTISFFRSQPPLTDSSQSETAPTFV